MKRLSFAVKLSQCVSVPSLLREAKDTQQALRLIETQEGFLKREIGGELSSCLIFPSTYKYQLDSQAVVPKELLPYVRRLLLSLKSPIYNARILKASSQSIVRRHHDPYRSFEFGVIRLVIPVDYKEGVTFSVNKKRVPMRPGEIWWVDVSQVHNYFALRGRSGTIITVDVGITSHLISLFPKELRTRIKQKATLDPRAKAFVDSKIVGEYTLPRPIPPILPPHNYSKRIPPLQRFKIVRDGKQKMKMVLPSGHSYALVKDSRSRIRIQNWGPGLFFGQTKYGLRMEARGLLNVNGKCTQIYSLRAAFEKNEQ